MNSYLQTLFLLFAFLLCGESGVTGAETTGKFTISGPPVMESLVFAVLADQVPDKVHFIPWHSPSQARALIIGKKVNASIITVSGAATFHNKGVPVSIAGLFETPLWVVSNQTVSGQLPLKGTLLFPFGHKEMPELVFNAVYDKNLPDLAKVHTSGPLETVNRLLLGKANHALLAEPAATMAQEKSGVNGQPLLTKNLNLAQAWEKKFNGTPLYVSALSVFGGQRRRTDDIEELIDLFNRTRIWIGEHPAETIKIAREKFPAIFAQLSELKTNIVAAQLLSSQVDFDAAYFFLERMYEQSPDSIGGKLPEAGLFPGESE
ncbi:hypothetical protein [Desulfogranum japonicum]|uniref:hypothetical protein n=1 Tax=Desulfogranum japonicum TaxID=231447 RepID=UPI00040DB520|nr:hypothetical protein [Desulfogranum japonicum]